MKKVHLVLLTLLTLAACKRSDIIPENNHSIPVNPASRQTCNFGEREFNLVQRPYIHENFMESDAPAGNNQPVAVLLLDFDGHTVRNTSWNYNGDIICSPANLTALQMNEVITRVSEDFSPFVINITTNETIYNQCNVNRRMRVIVTETWQWFGQAGGTSFIGSFTWGDNTPCFVFSSLLNYNVKKIAEAISHESGHTLGLHHQSNYDPSCQLLEEYYSGIGSGQTGWAPLMGQGYYRNMTTWRRGTNIYGCSNIQDDLSIINTILAYKADDHSSLFNKATSLNSGSGQGCINNNIDLDLFVTERSVPVSITINPVNIGSNNEGANIDIQLKIFNRDRNLISVINDPNNLSAMTSLPPGKFYIGVESSENANTNRYGQLGNYTVSIN